DGRLAMEVKTLHPAVIQELIAVTDVVVPGGKGDRLRHVWLQGGHEVHRTTEETSRIEGPKGVVRLRSSLTDKDLPADLAGSWHVDVETEDGQLVGRAEFEVVEECAPAGAGADARAWSPRRPPTADPASFQGPSVANEHPDPGVQLWRTGCLGSGRNSRALPPAGSLLITGGL